MDAIDWDLAQWTGEQIARRGCAQSAPALAPTAVAALSERFADRVSEYSGFGGAAALPPLEAIDRPAWIAANLRTIRPILEPLAGRNLSAGRGLKSGYPLQRALRSGSGLLLGAQVGAMTGLLSQRVLGQYDISLLDADAPPRLLLVAPNLAHTASSLHVDHEQLVTWVAIHEVTHAVQFTAAPWLQGHLAKLLKQLIERMQVKFSAKDTLRSINPAGVGTLLGRLRRVELLRLTLGEDRWELMERMQSVMSLIEGHAEHVMDAIGAQFLPALDQLRGALDKRREGRPTAWRLIEKLMGLELKMRQYRVGRSFCDAIVAAEGPSALARAFSGPQALPSAAELREPRVWLQRLA